LIISGGENVYPAEIESVLLEHPAITEVGVAGQDDETFGQRPVAWVVATPGTWTSPGQLRDHCLAQLAGYKCPVKFHWVAALPRTASGKLIRRELGGVEVEGHDLRLAPQASAGPGQVRGSLRNK
jgi:acyl-CoA synthetase (AMP-forming)/AMP-acid ligase II